MKGSGATTILSEETIRAMAVFGVLAFGVVPLAHGRGIEGGAASLGAVGIAVLGFVLLVPLRWKTGRELKIRSTTVMDSERHSRRRHSDSSQIGPLLGGRS